MSAETQKIPKIIHYCWFGKNPKPELVLKCVDSWKRMMPDYEIREWNEDNFDINSYEYAKSAYSQKKWAFVSDVVRLEVLDKMGGIYLDTDMYVLNKFDDFLHYDLILGKEDKDFINAAMLASNKNNMYIKDLLNYYKNNSEKKTIPIIMTEMFNKNKQKYLDNKLNIKIFDPIYFYPFSSENIKEFNYKNAPKESYAVHLWNYSWGHPLNKFIKRLGLYYIFKNITETLKIKKDIKKILNME